MRTITFDEEELNTIYEDQIKALQNYHIGEHHPNIQDCHIGCFDLELDHEELEVRQAIMNRILEDAAET